MAGRSLGTLTIDLIASTGGFTSGMDKAEKSSAKWRSAVINDIGLATKAMSDNEFAVKDAVKVQETLSKATESQKDRFSTLLKIVDQSSNSFNGLAEKQKAIKELFKSNAITTNEYIQLTTDVENAAKALEDLAKSERKNQADNQALAVKFKQLRAELDPTSVAFEKVADQQKTLSSLLNSGQISPEYYKKLKSELDKISDSMVKSDTNASSLRGSLVSLGKSTLAAGAALAASTVTAGVAALSLIKSTSDHVTETDRWAKSLGISTSALIQWQYAAEKAGLSGDNIADIFKDLNDKIGDAVLNKSGEAAQALDTLGLSAKKLQELSPDKQLLAIAKAMDGMNVAQKTNIYESLGNDLTKLMPLLNDGAKGLDDLKNKATDLGIAPDDADIEKLVAVNKVFQDWGDSIDGFKNRFVVALGQIDLTPINESLSNIQSVLTNPATLQGMSNLVSGALDLANFVSKVAAGLGNIAQLTGQRMAALSGKIDDTDKGQVSQRVQLLDITGNGDTDEAKRLKSRLNFLNALTGKIKDANQAANAAKGLQNLLEQMGVGNSSDNPYGLGKDESNQNKKPPKPPKPKVDHAALKLDNSFSSTEQAYLKQIALIDTTGKKSAVVTEQQKLAFDLSTGKLAGLNALQQKRLQSLAAEVDHLNAVKKANEDNAKALEYVSSLHKENEAKRQGLDADFIGAYSSSDQRDRLRQLASIRQDFAGRQTDLQSQYDSGDIDKDLYDQKTKALSDSLEEQLKIQTDYYNNVDALRNNGTAGFMSGLSDQINASADLYSNMQQVGAQTFSNLTDMITQWAETGKLNVKDFAATFLQSMGSALLQYAAAQVAMAALSAFTSWIGVPYVGPAVAPAQATAAAAGAGVFMTAIGSSLHGMAHDGIDSVPETGTWLLQKGERVTTAQTSAKLDATLERVASQSGGGTSYSPTIHIGINGNPSDATIQLVQKAAQQGARDGYNMVTRDLSSGEGKVHKALTGNYKTGRKIG
ncbi:phage tail tape measure protein [Rosenbergiella collisarenosi]|uniref:phage tail tape measure protein n=1 Tax=Rosenbergiella collisarenosi TaxID=1544695 RepID=UPI001BDB4B96|nr:phage tail tape measure protein [Rosenbergiella collisarenosi]MBT0720603.1 phage tail tape measure protein [Rosenbergiella collisarenosi]